MLGWQQDIIGTRKWERKDNAFAALRKWEVTLI